MNTARDDDPVDPTADQQARRPDALEDWLTDLRVTLSDDPPDWLTPDDDIPEPTPGSGATPLPTGDQPPPDDGTPAPSTPPDGSGNGEPPQPPVGRHRAVE